MIPHAMLLAIILPAISAVALYIFRKRAEKHAGWIATMVTLLSVLMILGMATDVVERGSVRDEYGWIQAPSIRLTLGFFVDNISFPIGLAVSLVSFFSCLYSIRYMKGQEGQSGYYANLLLFMTGMIGVIFSSNLLQFYLFWELMLVPSYFLIAFWGKSNKRLAIGFKYFIFTHFGALCMLLGIISIYVFTGTFDLIELPLVAGTIPTSVVIPVFALLLIGFSVKMAIFPVHTWLPGAHSEAPAPISAMLSGLMIKSGAYAIARILIPAFGPTVVRTADALLILGIITMVYGGIMALAQTDIKRLLAYSSISQMGYIFFGLSTWQTGSTLGVSGALFHIVNHALCKSLLFLCAGVIIHQTGTRSIGKLGGLAEKMPITCVACFIGALSLAGTPPLNGFWSEWMIFSGGVASGKFAITLVAIASTILTAGYYLWFLWRVFFGPTPEDMKRVKDPPWLLSFPIVALAAATVVIGLWPDLVLSLIT